MDTNIELVYMVPFVGVQGSPTVPEYKYKKLNGMCDVNKRSKDKEMYQHCYDDLIPGENYIVITRNYKPNGKYGRWVFVEAVRLPDLSVAQTMLDRIRHLDPFSKIPGYNTTWVTFERALQEVVQIWKVKQKLNEAKKLIDDILQF